MLQKLGIYFQLLGKRMGGGYQCLREFGKNFQQHRKELGATSPAPCLGVPLHKLKIGVMLRLLMPVLCSMNFWDQPCNKPHWNGLIRLLRLTPQRMMP